MDFMQELPLGFGMALAQRPDAMAHFCALSEARQSEILQRVHTVRSKQEMHQLVAQLTEEASGGMPSAQ